MKQHVISEWLLRAFARGRPLWQYDKLSREISAVETDDFLVEVDAHSVEIEQAFHAIEVRASRAAQTLAKPVRHYPPGLYAVAPREPPPLYQTRTWSKGLSQRAFGSSSASG